MKATLFFSYHLAEKARNNLSQTEISSARMPRIALLIVVLMFHVVFVSFSQERTNFLSRFDSCHMYVPRVTSSPAIKALTVGSPIVRVAYIIPSNRTAQPDGVANLQNAIKLGQQFYRNGNGRCNSINSRSTY
jgi:hypothetical protein